jgi:aspartate kinase
VVVVLSAMGDTTDELLEKAYDINPDAPKREMDMLLACGEQTSVALMAMALSSLQIPAISLNAFQVAMHTSSKYSNARFKRIDTERINNELEAKKVVIVTGFQGINKYDDLTTLGRGGSDTTAVALAAALRADACEIYTDVEGVYTADPRVVPKAHKIEEISYDEMLELATLGAKVLHNRSVELAKKYGVQLIVRSSLNNAEGTTVKEVASVESMLVSGVAVDKDAARIAIIGLKNEPGIAFKVFDLLAKHNINVDVILQSIGRDDTKDISFTVDQTQAKEAVSLLKENKERLTIQKIEEDETVAKLSIVGAGMQSNAGVAAKMFEALYGVGVNIRMIATSEIRITVLIDIENVEVAMKAVHAAFLED